MEIDLDAVDIAVKTPGDFAAWASPSLVAMRRLALRLAPDADAQDVVQEALTRAWLKWRQFDPHRGTPTTWLLAITADQARTARRARRRWLRLVDDAAPLPETAQRQQEADRDADLERAIRRLPERQQMAVHLHYFVGLPVDETAAVMGCAPGTVKSTLFDARARLRDLLGDDDD